MEWHLRTGWKVGTENVVDSVIVEVFRYTMATSSDYNGYFMLHLLPSNETYFKARA